MKKCFFKNIRSFLKSPFGRFRGLLLLFIPFFCHAIDFTKLTCEMADSPLAITSLNPRFGWQMKSSENGTMQTAYELEIKGENFEWQSGKIISNKSQLIKYNGNPLESGKKYLWRVRVWDEKDKISEWSNWSEFRTAPVFKSPPAGGGFSGFWIGAIRADSAHIPVGKRFPTSEMKTPEYKAIWNDIDTISKKSIVLRKSFLAQKDILEAIAYICGLGHYEFSINGKKVGDSEFAPFWSDYDKTLYYNTFDVTGLLKKGENVLGVLLGNGFYNSQGGRYSKLKVSFGAPTLFIKTIIRFTDNTTTEIVSDGSWKYTLSPITFNDIYGGEDYDARLEQKGWNKASFDDSNWKPVVIQDAPNGKLTPQQAAPVKIMKRYGIQSVKKLSVAEMDSATLKTKRKIDPSAFVLDMGQNLSGFPEITVRGKKGDKITLVVAEALTEEGAANQRQTGRQHLYHYTLKGEGDETWHPRFSYYGFRYIHVEGAVLKGHKNPKKLPLLKDIKSCFVHNSVQQVSTFETSNEMFNKTHMLIKNAVKSNMQAVFTDCPHREKLGWLEQVHLNGPGLMYNFDLSLFFPKIMKDIADTQYPNGKIPTTAPLYTVFEGPGMDNFAESPEWSSTFMKLPWLYYQYYGDSTLIVEYYHQMRLYIDYLATRADNHILKHGLGDWYDYGDFKAGFSKNTPVELVATAYYYSDLISISKAAAFVGNSYDLNYYTRLAEEVRNAFNTKFFNADTKQYGTGSQTANAMAVYMELVEPQHRTAVLENLKRDIVAHGNRLTTGDIGNRYLFQTLATNNMNELMYTMHNHEEAPGYGFQLMFGATTLTEQWDPRMGSSWNHFMMGQIDEWFFASLAGIQTKITAPGFQHFVIRPEMVGNLKFVKASHETLYGKISVDWKLDASPPTASSDQTDDTKNFTLNISVPVNCTADVFLPGEKEPKMIKSGSYTFNKEVE